MEIRPQQPGSSTNSGIVAPQHQQSSLTVVAGKPTSQTRGSGSLFDLEKPSIMAQQLGFLAEPQQFAVQPQQSVFSVAPREKIIQLPEQSGFYPNFRTGGFQPEYQNVHVWNSNQNQIPHDLVERNGVQGVRFQNVDKLHVNYKQPNFHMNRSWNCINDKSTIIGSNKLPETNYHRQQLRSMNHSHPAALPQRQGFLSQQLCRYHAQGRCYYGKNCKFLHEAREVYGAGEKRSWR